MIDGFKLHSRLEADTAFVADWPLSRVLLMNDARFPWLILVPQRTGLVELHDLAEPERAALMEEIARVGRALKSITGASKINTAALGNQVLQLHVHVIARMAGDAAWPGPVWDVGSAVPYDALARDEFISRLRLGL